MNAPAHSNDISCSWWCVFADPKTAAQAVGCSGYVWYGLIKLPAPRERLLALSGTLQHTPEYHLFQGGVRWGIDFSIIWVYASIVLASCLKSAMPTSKR